MTRKVRLAMIAVPVAAALTFGGVAIAGGTGGDDSEGNPIVGSALDRAKAIALEHTGGGRVTATEVGDEEGYYEVEVTGADGHQVDVHLTRDFQLITDRADREGTRDGNSDDD